MVALFLFHSFAAQAQDSTVARLEPVVVEVGRGAHRSPLELPFAVSVATPDSSRPGQRHLLLDETLAAIPGVAVSNRNNPSQDPRISIRGFGARSAFGVRGIRVLRDGVPLTMPDGQTPVDYLDLESVGRVEVLRGSASSLYGNAGGGVVDIRSSDPAPIPLLAEGRWWTGSYGNRRLVGKASGSLPGVGYHGNVAHTLSRGFRDYSGQRATTGFARVGIERESGTFALQFLGMNMPLAENPGALTASQMATNSRMADPLSIRKRARKSVTQSQLGATARRAGNGGVLEAAAYVGVRSLDNPLPFAVVDLGRTASGISLRGGAPWEAWGMSHRWTAGAELQLQNDSRRNFTNCNDVPMPTTPTAACPFTGRERGVITLDQRETVMSTGAYLRDEVRLGSRYIATAAVRGDRVRFEVRDRLIQSDNPDDSGRRSLAAISPMVGLLALLSQTHSAYVNISSAFETPTATELGNQPSGAAGINRVLQPQKSTTYETGVKGSFGIGVQYDAAVFATAVVDELIPFDIPAGNGRRYFRNAGRTSRRGLELAVAAARGPLEATAAYTYARYRFRDFTVGTESYAGNTIPGIPRQLLQGSTVVRTSFGSLVAEATIADRAFVDDSNSDSAPGYVVFGARLNLAAAAGRAGAELTIGSNNLLDRRYASSLSVNAAGGKYFEPATGRSVFVGLSLKTGFPALR